MVRLRDANEEDIPMVTEICNEVMRNTNAIYQEQELTVDNRLNYYRERINNGFPFLVAVELSPETKREEVVGYATYGPFRSFYGYRFTVEHSVHVKSDQRGKGIGTLLLSRLLEIAAEREVHVIIAAIESENVVSMRMHEKYGFEYVARMPEVGNKRGQWLTLVLMQKILS